MYPTFDGSNPFANKVLGYLDAQNSITHSRESARLGAPVIKTGHPRFEYLDIGQHASCEMVSVFLDLTGFTSRTFWEDSKDMAILANAVLGGFTDIVQSFGGHVLGLRGDGLFAGFGPVSSAHKNTDVVLAAAACNKALEDVRKSLNPQLENRGIEAVKVRAGLDFGTHTFTRTGTRESNEVNVVGFASNFAAKCEKLAASWEIVVGEEFADRIADKKLLSAEGKRPKSFTSKGQTKLYSYFGYRSPVKPEQFRSVIEELNGRALDEVFS